MIYYLDTDTCVFALRGDRSGLADKFRAAGPNNIKIPSLVAAELMFGAQKCDSPLTAQKVVAAFLAPFESVPFDLMAADVYARVRCSLESKGQIIGPNDLIIAAGVLSRQGVLVSHNTKEFERVDGLKLEDWSV